MTPRNPYAIADPHRTALDALRSERDAALAEVERLREEVGALLRQRAGLRPVGRVPWRQP